MFNRDNAVGFIMLGACAVVAVFMLIAIQTGERPELNLNPVVSIALGVIFFVLVIFGMFRNRISGKSSGGGRQWPDPQTGRPRKSLWDRLRGR
ncbi:MAG: hypothetical protein WKF81_13165 [Thermomicrobiales bacterium]